MLVSDEIIKVLDAISDKIGVSIDWSVENVLPYLENLTNKFIQYEIGTSIFWIITGIILIIGSLILLKYAKINYKDGDTDYFWYCVIGFIVSFGLGIIIIGVQTLDIITCYTFPEKIILENILSYYSNM